MNSMNSLNKTRIKLPKLPLFKNNYSINNNISQSQNNFNKFHFCFRFGKPLKLAEPTINYLDNFLLLTKLQKAKLKRSKIRLKQFKKENKKLFSNSSDNANNYINMIPVKIWEKCVQTYDECKQEFKKEKNSINNKSKSIVNLNYNRNKKKYFENQGLSKFIDKIEKSDINHFI